MATFNVPDINGTNHIFDVAGYDDLNPDDQKSTMGQLAKMANEGVTAGSPAPDAAPTDTSVGGMLQYMGRSVVHGEAETMKLAKLLPDGTPGKETLVKAGQAAENAVGPQDPNYSPAHTALNKAMDAGHLLDAVGYLPRAIGEAAADIGVPLAETLGKAPLKAAAWIAQRFAGENANARAANNNRAEPTVGDLAGSLPTTALQVGTSLLGAGAGVGGKLAEAAPALLKPVAKVATEALGGAANDAATQLGNSVGTDKGAQLDPGEVAGAALTAAGVRAAGLAAKPVADAVGSGAKAAAGAVGDASDNLMSRTVSQPVSVEHAESIVRANDAVAAASDSVARAGGKADPFTAANHAKSEANAAVVKYADAMKTSGLLTDADMSLVRTVQNQALRHNNSIGIGDGQDTTSYDQLKSLPIPAKHLQPLVDGLLDLNTLSSQSFRNNATGPFQQIGSAIGKVAAPVGLLAAGQPVGAAASLLGLRQTGQMGAKFGGAIDNMLGTSAPPLTFQSMAAQRYLARSGAAPDASVSTQSAMSGLPAAPAPNAAFDPTTRANAAYDNTEFNAKADYQRQMATQDNQARDAAQAQGLATALAPLRNGQVQAIPDTNVLAQKALDRLSLKNATALAAVGKAPTFDPQADQLHSQAAVSQAMMNAQKVLRMAGVMNPDDALNRMSVGNPPVDPVQVGSPQPGGAPPGAPRPPQGPPQAPAAAPQSPPPAPAPMPAQAAPPQGHVAYAINGAARRTGHAGFTPQHVAQGINDAAAAGAMSPLDAARYNADPTQGISNHDHAAAIQDSMIGRAGLTANAAPYVAPRSRTSMSAVGLPDSPIRDQAAWDASKASYQNGIALSAREARSVGLPVKAQAIEDVGNAIGQNKKSAAAGGHNLPAWMTQHGPKER